MEDFPDDKEELLQKCPSCEGEYYHPSAPHKSKRYWVFSIARRIPQKSVPSNPIDHDSHLVGTIQSPLNNYAQHKVETLPADYWNPELYFGEPTYESDRAWNALIYPRSFRVHRDEAVRLNITDSILVQPGEDFGTMLGALHNLHCLRRIRQMLYPDYYYPDASPEETEHNRVHAFHCLESIRTSVQCYPDLNPHPYFWSKNKYHPVTVSSKVTRQCTDWQALQQILESRNFQSEALMANTGPLN